MGALQPRASRLDPRNAAAAVLITGDEVCYFFEAKRVLAEMECMRIVHGYMETGQARSSGQKASRQIAPRCVRMQYSEGAVEDTPIIHSRHTARLSREQWPDGGPLIATEFVALAFMPGKRGGFIHYWDKRQADA
jgi:hypothetical protein